MTPEVKHPPAQKPRKSGSKMSGSVDFDPRFDMVGTNGLGKTGAFGATAPETTRAGEPVTFRQTAFPTPRALAKGQM
jgi:hypothetical protein